MRFRLPLLITLALLACTLSTPASAVDCVTGAVTVSQPNDPGFEGLYKYCVTASWDVGQFGLSHIDFFLELENCECACDDGIVQFPSPSGTSDGEGDDGACTVEYEGDYLCMGDPSIPDDMNGPAVKHDALSTDDCEPGVSGSGTWCFYSSLPPAPPAGHTVAIKHGQEVCYGQIVGPLPMCQCSTGSHHASWGQVKSAYR